MRRYTIAALVVVLALFGAACSGGEGSDTTAANGDSSAEVVFGSGSLPETFPESFPMPTGSSVGSTMVVPESGFTEVVVRVSAEQAVTAKFFDQALAQNGFEVESSSDEAGTWVIVFSLDGSKGTIDIGEPVQGISQALVRYNIP
ncbi:MAG: hypothetical protein GY926_07960 [bacterium]|nr:hypothetical protein [bacterium]